jgi:hypothetical protein
MAAGVAAAHNAHYDVALDHLQFAEKAFESAGRKGFLAWVRFEDGRARTVGVIAGIAEVSELDPGARALGAARTRFEEKGDHRGASLSGMFAGVNAVLRGDPAADELLESALAEARLVGVVDVEAMAWAMGGLIHLRDGDAAAARGRFEEAATSLRRERNWLNAQICTALAAYAASAAGDGRDADRLAAEACRLQLAFGTSEWHALTLAATALTASASQPDLSERLVRTLDRHQPLWRQLIGTPFDELAALSDVGPGGPATTLDPLDALRLAADRLGPGD